MIEQMGYGRRKPEVLRHELKALQMENENL